VAVSFEILPGLPATGPYPEQFSRHGGTHREGFVVRVVPEFGEPWTGNFQGDGYAQRSAVFHHPDGRHLIVVARGVAYVVDPATRRLSDTFSCQLEEAIETDARVVLATGCEIIEVSPVGRWTSPQVSLDGIKDLRLDGDRVHASGWLAGDEPLRPIEIDLATHEVLSSAV
jgi:hypothetical protein